MNKKAIILLTVAGVLLLPACKKAIDASSLTQDKPAATPVGTPIGNRISKTIGKSGGSISSADGNAELIFPAGALTDNTIISIQAITNNAPNGIGNGYRLLPEGVRFLQPLTLKLKYRAEDLAATIGDLMGIAFQDSSGIWYRVNNFTNDTVNKTISAPIKHFTDYTPFDLLFINPPNGTLKVNKSMILDVDIVLSDDDDLAQLGPHADEELAPLTRVSSKKIVWSANGVVNGNSSFGTLTSSGVTGAGYKAPAKVPSQNPVAVSAMVDVKFKYHGKKFDKTTLISNITIDMEKYLLEIKITETADPFVYTDTASMTIVVVDDKTVSVSDIKNFAPKTNPPSATNSGCTSTWIQDGIGEINITSVSGDANGPFGDPNRVLNLNFTHTGSVSPKFHRVCPWDDAILGGFAIPGFPSFLSFALSPGLTSFETADGQVSARLTMK